MRKEEFLEELGKRLKALNEQERQDILTEYSQYIDDKMSEGLTEEEATATFGDMNELVRELLSAYSSDPDFKYKSIGNQASYYFSQFASFINDVANSIPTLTGGEVFGFLVKLALVMLVLAVVGIPFSVAQDSFRYMLRIFPSGIASLIYGIVKLIIDIVYGLIYVYTLYIFTKKNLVEKAMEKEQFEQFRQSMGNPGGTADFNAPEGYQSDMNGTEAEDGTHQSYSTAQETGGAYKNNFTSQPLYQSYNTPKGRSFMEGLVLFILKLVAALFLFTVSMPLFGIIVAFGICVAFALQGFPLVGASIVLLGMLICGLAVVAPLCGFISSGFGKN